MLGFVSAHIPWNAISNPELWRSYNAWRSDLVFLSTSTLSNICRREYTLTVDANKNQLPSRNKVSEAFDRWTSRTKLAITLVIDDYMDQNWALGEVHLASDEVDSAFFSYFKSSLRIASHGSTYWSTASRTFEGSSSLYSPDWRQCTRNYKW